MDALTKRGLTELQFYLHECRGNLGVCFNEEVPKSMLSSSPIKSFYYYQRELKRWSGDCMVQGELDELPFLTDSIDLFIIWHNLNFHPNPQKILKEFWRALTPNGVLLIVGINTPCIFSRLNSVAHKEKLNSRIYLTRHLVHQGFQVEVEHTFGFHPVSVPDWLVSWLDTFEVIGQFCTPMLGSNFLLQARKPVLGLNLPLAPAKRKVSIAPNEIVQPTRRTR